MNYLKNIALFVAFFSFLACSHSGKSAGEEFCDCHKEDNIIKVAKCKKEVLKKYKEDLKNEEFLSEFVKTVEEYDE